MDLNIFDAEISQLSFQVCILNSCEYINLSAK